jgi:hypothetical protein
LLVIFGLGALALAFPIGWYIAEWRGARDQHGEIDRDNAIQRRRNYVRYLNENVVDHSGSRGGYTLRGDAENVLVVVVAGCDAGALRRLLDGDRVFADALRRLAFAKLECRSGSGAIEIRR